MAPFRWSEHVPLWLKHLRRITRRVISRFMYRGLSPWRLFKGRTFFFMLPSFPTKCVSKLRHKNFGFRYPGTRYLHQLIDCDKSTKVHASEIRAGPLATGQRVVSEFGCAICKDTFFVPAGNFKPPPPPHNHACKNVQRVPIKSDMQGWQDKIREPIKFDCRNASKATSHFQQSCICYKIKNKTRAPKSHTHTNTQIPLHLPPPLIFPCGF
jgi:hypothetical protein